MLIRRVLFVTGILAVFFAGFATANYLPSARLKTGQTFTIAPSDDSAAASGVVEIVAIQNHLHMKRIIFRASTPNNTARRAVEVVMEREGYVYWDSKRYLSDILEVDGWVYMWGIFVSK